MLLIEQIRAARMVAYKEKRNIERDVLGCLIADACKNEIMDSATGKKTEPDDKKVLAVIKKFIEGAEEMKASSKESYDIFKANEEIMILDNYRPKQLNEDQIEEIVRNLFRASLHGDTISLGAVMKYMKQTFEGQYDAGLTRKIFEDTVNG